MLIKLAAIHMVYEWARLARGEPLQTPPFLDRSVFRAGQPPLTSSPPSLDDFPEYKNPPLLLGQVDNSEERKKKSTMAMLRITKSQVEQLRKMANDDKPIMARGFTRFETICGYIWRIACKARKLKKEQPTVSAISVDSRNCMRPKLPREYFGNANFNVTAQSVVGDLTSKPLGFAASKVREAIEKVTNEYVRSSIELLKSQKDLTKFQDINKEEGAFYGNPNIEIVSWLTLPLYGFDFGWGKEQYMGLGSHGTEGNFVLLPGIEGDGSVIVAMCLQDAHMNAFKKHFYEGIISTTIGLRAAL